MNATQNITIQQPYFHLPAVRGTIERRMLVNFRCDPGILQRLLPAPFRPKLIRGWGMGGICLIRLGGIRPAFLPAFGGMRSENAAHRIAVEWEDDGATKAGVFIPRRDTNALVNRLAGGKLFPGVHHAASFLVSETRERFGLEMRSVDGTAFVSVQAHVAEQLPGDSIFQSLDEASDFFEAGALGWSCRAEENTFDGLELRCEQWRMEPLAVDRVESSFFGNGNIFPAGSTMFDSAFLMRDIPHEWRARGRLTVERATL